MDIDKKIVVHKKYGEGIVQAIFDGKISVQFSEGSTRVFLYPDAFKKYLKYKLIGEKEDGKNN